MGPASVTDGTSEAWYRLAMAPTDADNRESRQMTMSRKVSGEGNAQGITLVDFDTSNDRPDVDSVHPRPHGGARGDGHPFQSLIRRCAAGCLGSKVDGGTCERCRESRRICAVGGD